MHEISGKTILVTGASQGIGEATVRHLAAQGAVVAAAARSAEKLKAIVEDIADSGATAYAIACNVADFQDVVGTVNFCVEKTGRLDVLVNNAGTIEPIARIADSDPEQWGMAIDVNLKGVYHCTRAALPVMEKQGGGIIINMSSGAATGALEGWSHYCTSKAAALSLTRCTHKEVADLGIRVVGLSPGTVDTQMQKEIKASGINPVSQLDPSAHIPPEWVAQAVAYLCTEDAREFDGGDFKLRQEGNMQRAGIA